MVSTSARLVPAERPQPVPIAFSAVASFPKEEAHLGSFVPKDPIAEPGPVMDSGMPDELGDVGLAAHCATGKISCFQSCSTSRLGEKF